MTPSQQNQIEILQLCQLYQNMGILFSMIPIYQEKFPSMHFLQNSEGTIWQTQRSWQAKDDGFRADSIAEISKLVP